MFARLAALYLRLVALTSRIRVVSNSPEATAIIREQRPAIFTFWNQHTLFMAYYFGARKIPMLMTPKAKSDTLTDTVRSLGVQVACGSAEGGGRHALISLLDELKAGRSICLPADGSRGPEKKCKAGPLILAQESMAAIIPMAWKARSVIRLNRKYGQLDLPLPLNFIEIRLGAPIAVTKHHEFEDFDAAKAILSNQLNRLTESLNPIG